MGTLLHFALFEHASGYALLRVKEFDEVSRSYTADAHAFIKPVAFLHFKTVKEAVENVKCISEGQVPSLLQNFLRVNVPPKDSLLGVGDETLGQAILQCRFTFGCVWHAAVREVLRVIRTNFIRLMRALLTQPGNETSLAISTPWALASSALEENAAARKVDPRARLVVSLARARSQLNMERYMADTAVVRALSLIDDIDKNVNASITRLRACYGLHFPEVCHKGLPDKGLNLNDTTLVHLISQYPNRSNLIATDMETLKQTLSSCFKDPSVLELVVIAAKDSIGADLKDEDMERMQHFAQHMLHIFQVRQHYVDLLSQRVNTVAPNLTSLLDYTLNVPSQQPVQSNSSHLKACEHVSPTIVAARLISHAGSLDRLASMPSSRVLSIGASKSLFRKSGAVVANSFGLLGRASDTGVTVGHRVLSDGEVKTMSGGLVEATTIRRRAARLIASKAALACRADCFRFHNPIVNHNNENNQSETTDDPRLASGRFGQSLGEDVHHHLLAWSEAHGIHPQRTEEHILAQRTRRKKYRRVKRKAWLARKLARSTTVTANSENDSLPAKAVVKRKNGDSAQPSLNMKRPKIASGKPTTGVQEHDGFHTAVNFSVKSRTVNAKTGTRRRFPKKSNS